MVQENITVFELLKNFEVNLHGKKRNDTDWLNMILHDDFLEISKSGYVYTKKDVFDVLTTEIKTDFQIFSKDFFMTFFDGNIALLTYQSYEIDRTGNPFNQALRSSIWQLSLTDQWQLRFHQGTLMPV
ncbi:nuclear transport factor 2 family protein [Xenorhabdus sp. 18]|uniref:nuclear transport factor 2 family protein n=1 Tax=Xenorhabdus doucetiae TaxID=351671 RepID=UPI001998ADC7|nr:nuclear transport factor 2 family protein [Xenorhabdus sp. 18]MBD2796300.1 nuclear transport factor 2 family protein [Xenorhabdus sp. 18]